MYLLLPMTPATTGPLLMPTRSFIETWCSMRVLARDVDHADGHAHHARGVVGHRHRQAAHRHVGVAHGLDLLDAELVRGLVEAAEQAVQQGDDLGRRHAPTTSR